MAKGTTRRIPVRSRRTDLLNIDDSNNLQKHHVSKFKRRSPRSGRDNRRGKIIPSTHPTVQTYSGSIRGTDPLADTHRKSPGLQLKRFKYKDEWYTYLKGDSVNSAQRRKERRKHQKQLMYITRNELSWIMTQHERFYDSLMGDTYRSMITNIQNEAWEPTAYYMRTDQIATRFSEATKILQFTPQYKHVATMADTVAKYIESNKLCPSWMKGTQTGRWSAT